jgi:hypothetical protein
VDNWKAGVGGYPGSRFENWRRDFINGNGNRHFQRYTAQYIMNI